MSFALVTTFATAQQTSTRTEQQAKALCDSLYTLLQSGEDFGSLAVRYSEDPGSSAIGGLYKNCKFESFTPEFETVVHSLTTDQISRPFKSQYGYHIAKLVNKTPTTFTVRHILIGYQD